MKMRIKVPHALVAANMKKQTHAKNWGPSTGVREGFSVGMTLKPRAESGEWGAERERPSHFLLVWKVGVMKGGRKSWR